MRVVALVVLLAALSGCRSLEGREALAPVALKTPPVCQGNPYCGCAMKAQCAFDLPEQCGGCCAPEKCTGNPTRGAPR